MYTNIYLGNTAHAIQLSYQGSCWTMVMPLCIT